MPSIFYNDVVLHRLPVTCLFMEYVTATLADLPKEEREEQFYQVLATGLQVCGVIEGVPTEEQVAEIARRMAEQVEKQEERGGSQKAGAGAYFAGYLTAWAGKLSSEGICFYVANYDYDLARRLYCEIDQQTLSAIAKDKLQLEFERARVGFEASLFGFGGKYKDTPSEADCEFDLTKDSKAAEAALKSFGF